MNKVLQVTAVFWEACVAFSGITDNAKARARRVVNLRQAIRPREAQANACSSSTRLAERTPSKPNGLVGGLMVSQVLTLSAIP